MSRGKPAYNCFGEAKALVSYANLQVNNSAGGAKLFKMFHLETLPLVPHLQVRVLHEEICFGKMQAMHDIKFTRAIVKGVTSVRDAQIHRRGNMAAPRNCSWAYISPIKRAWQLALLYTAKPSFWVPGMHKI